MRVLGVSHKLGTTELRVIVQDEERNQVGNVRVRWFSLERVPPLNWMETALGEANGSQSSDPMRQLFGKL